MEQYYDRDYLETASGLGKTGNLKVGGIRNCSALLKLCVSGQRRGDCS